MMFVDTAPIENNKMRFFHTFAYDLWKRGRELPRTCLVVANKDSYPMWLELAADELISVECDYINIFRMHIEFTDAGYELANTLISFEEL